jgi:hypothetical protein
MALNWLLPYIGVLASFLPLWTVKWNQIFVSVIKEIKTIWLHFVAWSSHNILELTTGVTVFNSGFNSGIKVSSLLVTISTKSFFQQNFNSIWTGIQRGLDWMLDVFFLSREGYVGLPLKNVTARMSLFSVMLWLWIHAINDIKAPVIIQNPWK